MKIRTALLAAVAANSVCAGVATAATRKVHHHVVPSASLQLLAQVKALQGEVESLRNEVESQKTTQIAAVARLDTTESALQSTRTQMEIP